jgi:hypothetical protein
MGIGNPNTRGERGRAMAGASIASVLVGPRRPHSTSQPSSAAIIMDNTTTPHSATPSTPFPSSDASKPAVPSAPSNIGDSTATTTTDAKAAAPLVDGLIKRVTQSAHDAVDSVAAKVSSVTDGLQGGVDKAGDTRDEWIEAARDAIRQHPFAAVVGALVIGAALLSLRSSRDD